MTDGLTENVKNHVSGFAAARFLDIADDGRAAFDRDLDFKCDLLAPINERLLYDKGISGFDFVRHVSDFSRHGCKIDIGINHACAVRVPCNDFAVFVKPVSGPFTGGAAVERAVGFHAVELDLACDFAFAYA